MIKSAVNSSTQRMSRIYPKHSKIRVYLRSSVVQLYSASNPVNDLSRTITRFSGSFLRFPAYSQLHASPLLTRHFFSSFNVRCWAFNVRCSKPGCDFQSQFFRSLPRT
jgi:hypothetical protein